MIEALPNTLRILAYVGLVLVCIGSGVLVGWQISVARTAHAEVSPEGTE